MYFKTPKTSKPLKTSQTFRTPNLLQYHQGANDPWYPTAASQQYNNHYRTAPLIYHCQWWAKNS